MIIIDKIAFEKIIEKLNYFFDLDKYLDFLFLSFEVFVEKYESFGFSFTNFYTIRFYEESSILSEISNLLPNGNYYIIPLVNNSKTIYQINKDEIVLFLTQINTANFVIFESKMTWVLISDEHRKLSGLGNFIQRKMQKSINTRFGETKIMFISTDEKYTG